MKDISEIKNLKERRLQGLKKIRHLRKMQIAGLFSYMAVWSIMAALQSVPASASYADNLIQLGNFIEFIALGLCVASLILTIQLFIQSKKQGEINRKIDAAEKKNEITREMDARETEDDEALLIPTDNERKFLDYLPAISDNIDLSSSVLSTLMQFAAVVGVLGSMIGINCDINKLPEGTAMNTQGIVDTASNILAFSAVMLLVFYQLAKVIDRKNKTQTERDSDKKNMTVISVMAAGAFLILAGKVMFALESRGILKYTGNNGLFGGEALPLGLIIRVLGALVCVAAATLIVLNKNKEIQENKSLYFTNLTMASDEKGDHPLRI